ncbi:MAG TPA: SpoIIE family protein phosphatase [candidate division Zixibacteria bacterium]|nr:SpoIIE family protein phosphatase [candidate division Zixibacteria bacterium]
MPQAGSERAKQEGAPSLVLRLGGVQRTISIDHVPFTIGRKADRDLILEDPGISREHAVILCEEGRFFIADNGSRHGTFVNGERKSHAQLAHGDRITFGAPEPEIVFGQSGVLGNSTQKLLRKLTSDDDVTEIGKLMLFLQAARALDVSRVETDVLATLLEYAIKLVGAERGYIYLRDTDGKVRCNVGRDNKGNAIAEASDISHSVISDGFQTGAEFVVGDTSSMSMIAARNSIFAHDLRTLVAIPLRSESQASKNRIFGLLYLDSRMTTHNLSNVSHSILRAIAAEAAALVENARLLKIEHAAAGYRRELEIATSIQQSLIPVAPPSFDFGTVTARTIPCTEVGGDFYDFVSLPDCFIAILADISGKGISAALLASNIQGMLYSQLSTGVSLTEAVQTVNTFLCSRVSGIKYATMVIAKVCSNGELEILNCGHLPPAIVKDGNVDLIEASNMPVGLFCEASFESIKLELTSSARLVLYTDGLTEAENAKGDDYGQDRLLECLKVDCSMQSMFNSVADFCAGHPANDDRTAIIIERK